MNLERLRKCGTLRVFDFGEAICTEGEQGETAFLLLEGHARVVYAAALNSAVDVTTLDPGVIFGEMSLLENRPRVASVLADNHDTKVLEIGKDHFLDLIIADPDVGYGLMVTLLTRVDKTLNQIARDKVAHKIAFAGEVRRDKYYQLLKRMTGEQFAGIVAKDSEYALTLLKFLSHTLAEVDKNI